MRKLYVSDVDGTLGRGHAGMDWLEHLSPGYHRIKQLLEEAEPYYRAYKARKGSFNTYANFIVDEFWKKRRYVGVRHEDSKQAAREAFPGTDDRFYVFTYELLLAAKDLGYATAAITGSPQVAVDVFLRRFELDAIRGTVHVAENGVYIDAPIAAEPVANKGLALCDIVTELGDVDWNGMVAIGDSVNDIPMLEKVDYPICFKPNDELKKEAQKRNWPIVVEDRNTYHITMYDFVAQRRVETDELFEILPPELAHRLGQRLAQRIW